MGYTARESLKRKMIYLALLVLLFLGTAFGLGWAFIQGTSVLRTVPRRGGALRCSRGWWLTE